MSEPAATFRHRHPFRVRYSEVDYQGIVYVAHYVTYFDHGIHEFFRALPYDYTAIRATSGTDFHTVRTLVEYRRPLRFDERFEVEVRLGRDRPLEPDLRAGAPGRGRDRAARHRRDGLGPRRSDDDARSTPARAAARSARALLRARAAGRLADQALSQDLTIAIWSLAISAGAWPVPSTSTTSARGPRRVISAAVSASRRSLEMPRSTSTGQRI